MPAEQDEQRAAVKTLSEKGIGRTDRWALSATLDRLPDYLEPAETPVMVVRAIHIVVGVSGDFGVFTMTDRRALFLRYEEAGVKEVRYEIPYGALTDMEAVDNKTLRLVAGDNEFTFVVSKKALPQLTAMLDERVRAAYAHLADARPRPDVTRVEVELDEGEIERKFAYQLPLMPHATVRFQPPRPGFSGTLLLPPLTCAWCANESPTHTVTVPHPQNGPCEQGGLGLLGLSGRWLRYELDWRVEIPYCDECRTRAEAAGKHAVLWGEHEARYMDPDPYSGNPLETQRKSVPGWIEWMLLVFANAEVGRKFAAINGDAPIVEWKDRFRWWYGADYPQP